MPSRCTAGGARHVASRSTLHRRALHRRLRWTAAPCWIVWVSSWAIRWRPSLRVRLVLAAPEEDVVPVGEGPGAEVVAQAGRALVGVDAHVAEVGAEARLHERRARRAGSGLATGGGAAGSGLRVGCDARRPVAEPLHLLRRRLRRCTGRLDRRRRSAAPVGGHPHDRVGGAIGLLLQRVGGLAHRELGLRPSGPRLALHGRRTRGCWLP